MQKVKVEIINKAGLHARAASKLVELTVDGKSILSLMMLAAVKGTELSIEIDGADEDLAITAIVALINNRFGEDE